MGIKQFRDHVTNQSLYQLAGHVPLRETIHERRECGRGLAQVVSMSPHVDFTTRIFLSVVGNFTHSNKVYNVVCELVAKDMLAGEVETLP